MYNKRIEMMKARYPEGEYALITWKMILIRFRRVQKEQWNSLMTWEQYSANLIMGEVWV